MKSKIRVNRNCPKWHKHLYPLVWCAQHRFESARWSLRVHPFHSSGSGQWARHSFPYFLNLKLPLKGIRLTPPVYFTSVSILAKARTCDMNEVEASANAFFYKQSKWWLLIKNHKKSCIHDYFAIFWHFLLRLECAKIKGRHKNIFFFLFHVDHCPQFLFARVAAKMTFLFLLRFLFVLFALRWPGGGSEGKRRQKYLICIFYDQLLLQRKHRYNISVARGLQKR